MKVKRLSNKEIKLLINEGLDLNKKDVVEIIETEDYKLLVVNNQPLYFQYEGKWAPTLRAILEDRLKLREIIVDMGAVPFVVNGADVMRPGIREFPEDLNEGELIVVRDEKHKKPLAIGVAKLDGEKMRSTEKGKVVKNIHYIGDKIWNFKR